MLFVYDALNKVGIRPRVLLHGNADGVDTLAGEWAHSHANRYVDMNMDVEVCEPDKSKSKYDGDPDPYLTLEYARNKGKLHENTYILWTPPNVRRIDEFFQQAKRARTDTA